MVIFILLQGVIALFAGVVERVDSCASIQGCGTGCGNVKVDGVEYGDVCGTGLKDPLTNETGIYGGTLQDNVLLFRLDVLFCDARNNWMLSFRLLFL